MRNKTCALILLLTSFFLRSALGQNIMKPDIRKLPNATVGNSPKPIEGVLALNNLFEHYRLVALGEAHPLQQEHDFILKLVQSPDFANRATDIVVEFGNAKYQDLLDRYITGDSVKIEEIKVVWQNTTQMMAWDADCYETLFTTVRRVNQQLPASKKLRVVLADPPIDWGKINSFSDLQFWLDQREHHIGKVIIDEVLQKPGHKALLIFGSPHITRPRPGSQLSVTGQIEKLYPGSIFVIVPHLGFDKQNELLEPRLEDWKIGSFAFVKDTWLGEVDPNLVIPLFMVDMTGKRVNPFENQKFGDVTDGYLFVGKRQDLTKSNVYPVTYRDDNYWTELNRRSQILFGHPLDPKGGRFKLSARFWDFDTIAPPPAPGPQMVAKPF